MNRAMTRRAGKRARNSFLLREGVTFEQWREFLKRRRARRDRRRAARQLLEEVSR